LRSLSKSNAEVSTFASLFDCHYPEKNGAYTELVGIDPELIKTCCYFRSKRLNYSAASLGLYSLMSSKNILPEPPAIVALPLVPRPIAILSMLVRVMP
jgi:hypothetical protein